MRLVVCLSVPESKRSNTSAHWSSTGLPTFFFLEWDTRQVGNDFSTGVHRPTTDQPIWRTLFPFLGSLLHFLGFRILSHHQRFNIIKSKMIYTGYILAEIFGCSFAPCTRMHTVCRDLIFPFSS